MRAAAGRRRAATERIAAGVETFARRALRGRRLAWALLAEPVDPAVEAERLVFRRSYRDCWPGCSPRASQPATAAPGRRR